MPATVFVGLVGRLAREAARGGYDLRARDTWFPHPVYGGAGWVSVVNPDRLGAQALEVFDVAQRAARARTQRRRSGDDTS